MIEVFITDIQNKAQADRVLNIIKTETADLKINYDLNETALSFPCGHTILRMEGDVVNSDEIIAIVRNQVLTVKFWKTKSANNPRITYDRILGIKFSGQTRNVGMETSGFSN